MKKKKSKVVSKKQKQTQKTMKKIRTEDTVRLRKKLEETVILANEDRKKLLEIKKTRQDQLQVLEAQLLKNQGVLEMLKILLENKNND